MNFSLRSLNSHSPRSLSTLPRSYGALVPRSMPLLVSLLAPALPAGIEKISGGPQNQNANAGAGLVSISESGRYLAFDSMASNLTPNHPGLGADIFLVDRAAATIVCISENYDGTPNQVELPSMCPSITPDGRYVCFSSWQDKIVLGESNLVKQDCFVYDRVSGTKEWVSVSDAEGPAVAICSFPTISADGRYVVFQSTSKVLLAGGPELDSVTDVFLRDRQLGTTTKISKSSTGGVANGHNTFPILSGDGRYVVFRSTATNLGPVDSNGPIADLYRVEIATGATQLVTLSSSGIAGNGSSDVDSLDCVSHDGRFVAFRSLASNLVPNDTNGVHDVFLRDMTLGTTTLVSVSTSGGVGNGTSTWPVVSNDGRYVVFDSTATDLVATDINGSVHDVFVRDLVLGVTTLVSKSASNVQSNASSAYSSISEDGRFFGFWSLANNLVGGDTNSLSDLFVVSNCWSVFTAGAPGVAGSGGFTPSLDGVNGACIDGGYRIEIGDALGAAPSLLFVAPGTLPGTFPGFHLDLSGPYVMIPLLLGGSAGVPGAGELSLSGVSLASHPGLSIALQLAVGDAAAPHGIALSNASTLTVAP